MTGLPAGGLVQSAGILVQGVALTMAALLLLAFMRGHTNARVRLTTLAMVLLLALPAVRGAFHVFDMPRVAVPSPAAGLVRQITVPAMPLPETTSTPERADIPPIPAQAGTWLWSIWWLGTAALLLRLLVNLLRVRRLLAEATPATAALRARCGLGAGDRVELRLTPRLDVPAAAGLRRPCILLPLSAPAWSDDQLVMVVRHELAHLRHRDLLRHLMADLACALHWLNPLAWLLRLQMQAAAEQRADANVIGSGSDPVRYAEMLASFARMRMRAPTAALVRGRSFLSRRIDAVLRARAERRRPAHDVMPVILLTGVFVLVGVEWTMPRASTVSGGAPIVTAEAQPAVATLPGGTDSLVHIVLMSDDVAERRAAASRLAAEAGPAAIARFAVLFEDTCYGWRWRAARALRELRQPEAVPLLVHHLLTDDTPAVRAMAINAIATSGLGEGVRLLHERLIGAPPTQLQRVDLAIETLGGTRAHAPLRDAMRALRASRREPAHPSTTPS